MLPPPSFRMLEPLADLTSELWGASFASACGPRKESELRRGDEMNTGSSATVFPLRINKVIWTVLNTSGTWGVRRLECWYVWRMRAIMSVFWSRIQSGRAAVVKRRPNSIWLPCVFSAAYNGGKCGTPPSAAHTRAGTGKKNTHTCNKIKMIKRRGRDVMWRGRRKKDREVGEEWMMNERIILLVRALLSAGRRCSSRTPSVSQSAVDMWCMSVRECVRASGETRVFHQEARWVEKYWGKIDQKLLFFHTREGKPPRCAWEKVVCMREGRQKKKMGGEKRVCNCRAAVLSGGGCHLESGWLSSGH